jgi:hypothetical protein
MAVRIAKDASGEKDKIKCLGDYSIPRAACVMLTGLSV